MTVRECIERLQAMEEAGDDLVVIFDSETGEHREVQGLTYIDLDGRDCLEIS